jgi:hypothetical protein
MPDDIRGAILCLDLGAAMGWASRSRDGFVASGTQRFDAGGRHGYGVRFLQFRRWLTDRKPYGLDRIFYERILHHASGDSAHAYGAFVGTLAAWGEAHSVPYFGVNWATVKKYATGSGAAKKPEIIAAMRARGYAPEDDNEADALALLDYVMRARGPAFPPPPAKKRNPAASPAPSNDTF